ncbi:hypothetical protein RO22_00800 [Halomonas sp. KHS3]|nr:hypothetical protein RO22_00800 [Halomonas sp. KHS3]
MFILKRSLSDLRLVQFSVNYPMHGATSAFKSVDIRQRGLGDISQRLGSEERLMTGDHDLRDGVSINQMVSLRR